MVYIITLEKQLVHRMYFKLQNTWMTVFPKVNWSWMDIRSSKGVRITGPNIKFTGHSHTPQRRGSDSYWSFGPIMNNLLLDQTNIYLTLSYVRRILGMTGMTMTKADRHIDPGLNCISVKQVNRVLTLPSWYLDLHTPDAGQTEIVERKNVHILASS